MHASPVQVIVIKDGERVWVEDRLLSKLAVGTLITSSVGASVVFSIIEIGDGVGNDTVIKGDTEA